MSSPAYESARSVTPVPLLIHRFTDAVEYLAEAMAAGQDTKEIQVSLMSFLMWRVVTDLLFVLDRSHTMTSWIE